MEQYPNFFYQTFRGTLSHLTAENLKNFQIENINLSFNQTYIYKEAIFKFDKSFNSRKYFNIDKNTKILTSPLENGIYSLKGSSKKQSVKVLTNNILLEISNEEYLDIVQQLDSDFIVCLAEQPKNVDSRIIQDLKQNNFIRNNKKIQQFLQKTINRFPNKKIYVPIQLDSPLEFIVQLLQQIKDQDYYGIMLHDLKIDQNQIIKVLNVCEQFKKKIGLYGNGNIIQILFGLKNGIYDFNCEYPFNIANQGIALYFENDLDHLKWQEIKKINNYQYDFQKQLKNKLLTDEIFKKQLEPIQKSCKCYSCQNHTIAYIYHLLQCKEMTGRVLLTIHNLHSYQNLKKDIKKSIDLKILNLYIAWFLNTQTEK